MQSFIDNIKTNWKEIIISYFKNNNQLLDIINNLYTNKIIYPPKNEIFNCFNFFNIEETKVVIIGQDPYHNIGEAMGLSFSVKNGVKTPSSLRNIFKELESDLNINRTNTDLTDWANQGVLLLNAYLTVEENSPLSHSKIGWMEFTKYIIKKLDESNKNVVYILMGNFAKSFKQLIKNSKFIIETVHPSGLSANRGFFGCKLFSRCNAYMQQIGKEKINW